MLNVTWKTSAVISSILITSALLIGCTTPAPQVISVPLQLERPARPVLPKISIDEANAIPWATWIRLSERDRLRRQYAEQLELIIDSTRSEDNEQ